MAVSFTTIIGTTTYGFDWVNKVIEIEAGVLEITAADLKDAIHDAQDGTEGMSFDSISDFANPVVLTATSSTFLNVLLNSTWKILSLSVSGTFTVGSGNVVSKADGIDIFAPNNLVTLVNNTSAAGVLVTSAATIAPTQQQIRDAMKLVHTDGDASVDLKLNNNFAVSAAAL